jgi:hypothetical protein
MECNGSNSKRTLDYWTYLEVNYKEVAAWPAWMRGVCSVKMEPPQIEESGRPIEKSANGASA